MSRNLVVRPVAEQEANEAYDWYEEQGPGLGTKFRNAVKQGLDAITDNPLRFPVIYGTKVRHAVIRKFPYRIIFSIDKDESVVILSIFHDSRNPLIWRGRVE